jgi:DNA-binding NarL/FixJ family response regulator
MSCHLVADALCQGRYRALAAATPKRAIQLLGRVRFDVVLIGMGLSEGSPTVVRLIRQVQSLQPSLSIIVLLDAMDRASIVEAFRSGARGVFFRSESFETLCKCIRCVHEGQVWASSAELQLVLDELVERKAKVSRLPAARPLSKREEQITLLVAEGYSNRQISEKLDLSEHTIKNYLFRVFEKLGVSTRVGLTLYALRQSGPPLAPGPHLLPSKDSDYPGE